MFSDPAELKDQELYGQWLATIPVETTDVLELPTPTCGDCANYCQPTSSMWGYCRLRAEADIHPCNFQPTNERAAKCPFFRDAHF